MKKIKIWHMSLIILTIFSLFYNELFFLLDIWKKQYVETMP